MDKTTGIIVTVMSVAILASWLGLAVYSQWLTTIIMHTQIKVSQVTVGYDFWGDSLVTEILGFDGKEQLQFWGDVSSQFKSNHEYQIVYHVGFRGIVPIQKYSLLTVTEVDAA